MKHGIGRRLLSIVLSVMMLVSLLPTTAFAAELTNNSAEPSVYNSVDETGTVAESTNEGSNGAVEKGDTTTYVAKIGENTYATLDEAITAVKDGETIVVNADEYKLNGSLTYSGKAFTIKAADGVEVSFDMSAAVALHGAKITFEGVTFNYKTNGNYIGLQHADTLVYNNCTINGMVFLYAVNETFNSCIFKQTSADAYNVWTYGAKNVAFNSCRFECAGKAVLVYNEGTNTKTDLTVTDTEFIASAPVAGKAAIEIDTHLMKGGATVTVGNTTANGFDNGSNSGNPLWNDKKQTADTNKNTTVTVDGVEAFTPVATAAVAQIGETKYDTLDEALEYLVGLEQKDMQPTPELYALTLLDESAWNTATPVYWAAGTQSGFAAKLTDALTAAYKANAGKITIVCRPGADVGTMTHGHVADDITIFGNKAYVSGGECDLEVDTYKYSRETGANTGDGSDLNGDISIIAFQLDNLGVWGERHTTHTVNVALIDCDGKDIAGKANPQRVYISGTSGQNMIGVTDCDFKTANTAVYSNADGKVTVYNCTFEGSKAPVNINHKANGTMSVDVQDCTFTRCGDTGEWKQFAAPVRFVNSGSGTMVTGVQNTTFTGTVGSNGDILLGDGRTGQKSNDVSLYVSDTDANIQAQKPGYYNGTGTDATKKAEKVVKSNETLDTSVETLLPAEPEQSAPDGYQEDASGNVTISNEAGLFWFAKQVNEKGNNFAGKTVTLANNIALTKAWTPIGIYDDSKTHFKGTFDGQNHTVSGVEVTENRTNGVGFFGKVYTGTIKNLTVEGTITATNCNYVGGIVGHGYATISNCTFKGNVGSTENTMQVGGIAGSGGFTITNCSVYGNVTAECWAGGIVGNCQDGGAYTNCYVEGVISAKRSFWGGGAAGITPVPLYPSQVISSCYSNTVVKVAGEEVNCPIIAAYNNPLDYNGYTGDLKIYDNSWNKQKNSNDSYPIYAEKNGVGGVLEEGKDVSRDNNLVMLEDDLQYVTDLSKVRIMAGSAVTQEQVDALAVASIGNAKYISLAAAIAAANNGDTVTLLKNVTENVEIAKEKNLTLDLNGCILNGGTGTAKAALTNYGTITITDSSTTKTGTIKRDDNGTVGETSYYVIRNQGTMTIESGNVNNNSGYKQASSIGSMNGSSLICNGDCDEGGTLTINGGTFTQNNFIAIKNGALGVLHVTGGKITSNHSAIQNWFEADITGGEINGQLWTDAWKEGESVGKTTIGGDATFTGEIVMDIYGSVAPTLAITGGKLDVTNWNITTAAAKAGAKPAVSGGTFTSAVPAEYCAEGFIPTDNGDGTFGVKAGAYVAKVGENKYETLQAAINAAKAGDTVTLLVNTTEDVTINKDITLDLGGKTLTNTGAGKATVTIAKGATATVQNGSIIGGTSYYNIQNNGTATFKDVTATAGNTGSSMLDNWGTLTIESGTYEGGLNVVKSEEGSTLTINGGKFTGNYAPSSGYTAVILVYGNTTITGGEFIQSVTTTGSWAHPQVVMTGVVEGYEAFTTVTGGTFTNKKSGEGIFRGLGKATSDNFEVSGGTFNKSVPDSYFKTGYFAKKTADGYTADGPYAVRLGTAAGYATLEEAFAAAKSGDTITLLRDCESDRINLETKSITVDLNGKVLTSTAAYGVMFCAKNGHKITVKGDTRGSKLVGTLMVTAETDGRIEINGGTYESAQYCPIYINGAVSSENSKLTVKNATITAIPGDSNQDSGVAVYLAGYSTSTFTNTTITAPVTGLEIRAGKLTLTNCTVTGGSGEVVTNANGNGTTVTNAAVAISQHTTKKNIDVTITGGTYTATAAVYQTNVQGTGSEGVKASIKSGTFNGAVSAETDNTVAVSGGTFSSAVPENCCAPGYIPKDNGNGTYGVKEGAYVAKVDNVKYETLQEAINAAKGGSTVRLLADVTLTETAVFPAGKKVDLNLVGHNITATGTALRINGTTEIQSTGSNGVIESTGNVAVAVGDNASLTVYSGTLKGREGAVITGTSTGAKIEIRTTKPTLIATDNAVIAGNGSQRDGNPNTILVKGGTFIGGIVTEGYIACGIYAPWNDNVTVSGGTFNITNGAGIVARAGNVKVTGGTFNCGDGQTTGWVGDSKNKVPNAALVFDKAASYPALTDASQILVSGGTFSTDPAANGATLATGYVANKDESGMYKVAKENPAAAINGVKYDTLQAAINAAQDTKGGATITLLKNINTESYYTVNGDNPVTIDLAGYNITGSGISGLFYVTAKGDLTIKGEGTVTAVEDTGAAMAVWVRSPIAKVTLEGGTYTQQITNTADPHFDLIYVERGNVYVKGGTYEGATPDWTLNCKDENYPAEAKIEVTGGTFVGFDPANNTAEGEKTNFVAAGYKSVDNGDGTYTVTVNENVVAVIGATEYATLEEATDAAAVSGGTVVLMADVTEEKWVGVESNVTLDLNGHSITGVKGFFANGNVIDTSATKGVVSAKGYTMNPTNAYLPIYDSERAGYSFFNLKVLSGSKMGTNSVQVRFQLEATAERDAAFALMKKGATLSHVQACVSITWVEGTTIQSQTFTFNDAFMAAYCATADMVFDVVFSGLDNIKGSDVKAVAKFATSNINGSPMCSRDGKDLPIK